MRSKALLGLMILSIMACGDDSSSDDDKKDDTETDGGDGDPEISNGGGGKLPDLDDGDVNDCDRGDPCCINSDQYDFTRCNTFPDAGMNEASDAGAN